MDVRAIVFPLWAAQGQVTIQQSRKDSGGPSRPARTGTGPGKGLHHKTVLGEASWWQLPATLCRDSGGTVAPGGVRAPPRLHLDILQQKRTCFGRTKRSGAQHVEERRMPSLANVVVVGWHKNQVARASSGGRWKEHHLHNMYSCNTLR